MQERLLAWIQLGRYAGVAAMVLGGPLSVLPVARLRSDLRRRLSVSAGVFSELVGLAPRFRRSVRYTLTTGVLTAAVYYVVIASVEGAAARPAYAAARGGASESGNEIFGWMPGALRWLAFIPAAFVLSLLAGYAIGLPLSLLPINTQQLVPLVTTTVFTAAFIGVAEAVAPRDQKIVALTACLAGLAIASAAVFRRDK